MYQNVYLDIAKFADFQRKMLMLAEINDSVT